MAEVEIWGLGLMGLSLAAGLLASDAPFTVYGRDQSPAAEAFAAKHGVHIGRAPHPGWIVIAVPPAAVRSVLAQITIPVSSTTVITDLTSVKNHVLPLLASLPAHCSVVSSHPMAGREHGGGVNFRRDLYAGRPWALVPVPGHPIPMDAMRRLVEPLGAHLSPVSGEGHDRTVARTSHLPYLSALALSAVAAGQPDQTALTGPGFLSATRTAAGPPDLWSEILASNRREVRAALQEYIAELEAWDALLIEDSTEPVRQRIAQVQSQALPKIAPTWSLPPQAPAHPETETFPPGSELGGAPPRH